MFYCFVNNRFLSGCIDAFLVLSAWNYPSENCTEQDDIEEWLDRGSRERYDKQSFNLSPECLELPEVQKLVGLIHKHKRGLDQEVFIRFE